MINSLDLFEEIRFIVELLAAELLLVIPFARKKKNFNIKCILGFLIMLGFGFVFFIGPKRLLETDLPQVIVENTFPYWYIFLVVVSICYIKLCFYINRTDLLFIMISAYAIQHIEYVLVNEIVAIGMYPKITEHLMIYFITCAVTTFILYYGLYRLVGGYLRECEGRLMRTPENYFVLYAIMLIVLIGSSFMGQHAFRITLPKPNYQSALLDMLMCIFILIIQYSIFIREKLSMERGLLEQLLHERKKQYQLSKDTVDLVNHKCHDLKHQLIALKNMNVLEQQSFMEEIDQMIQTYDNGVQSENEVINTLLTQKNYYCEQHHINLTSIVDGAVLKNIKTIDIYTLIGNALDNAIECVEKYEDVEKRMVSMNISCKKNFISIQVSNYFDGDLNISDGTIVTTKDNLSYHGYGMKSMNMIIKKYNGNMEIAKKENMFILQMIIPIVN